MKYDWVSEQILNKTHADAVAAIVAQAKDDIIDVLRDGVALLPCGHDPSNACFENEQAHCLMCDAEVRHMVLTRQMQIMRRALKAIAKHGIGLSKVVAELTLKELRDAKRG